MASDIELRMISRAIRDRNLAPLFDLGVEEDWFVSDEAMELFRFARDWYKRYGECPTPVTVKEALPAYRLLKVEDSLEPMLDGFLAMRRQLQAIELLQDAHELAAKGDFEGSLSYMASMLPKITTARDGKSRDLDLTDVDAMPGVVARYMELRDLPNGLRGLPTGFPTIDRATSGLQNQQLVTIIAPPKTGKSTLALAIARNVHRLSDSDVLFVTFEQSNAEHEARYVAMVGEISHTALMTGKVSAAQEKKLLKALQATGGKARLILSDAPSNNTISGLTAKIEQFRPQVCFVDGVYLMVDEESGESNTAQALTNLTRSLHRMAQRLDIPIVISTQVLKWKMKKGQVDADAIGYSSSFFQDSDVIFGLQAVPEDEESRELKVVATRNCPKVSVSLDWDWSHTRFTERGAPPRSVTPDDDDDELDEDAA